MFPPITGVTTNLRPDIVIWSIALKTVIWGELSCPLEELILEAYIRKTQRYLSLEIALIVKGWRVHAFPFEVGSLGFVGHSLKKFLSVIGLRGFPSKNSHPRIVFSRAQILFPHLAVPSFPHLG